MRKIFLFVAFAFSLSVNAQTQQQWKDSISVLTKKIELNPKSLELRMRKAECNIALEQWQYALDEYSNILDLHPTHIGALYFRAFVNQKLHRYSFARADYEQVLKYEPDHKSALTGLILTKIEEQRLQEAYDQANHLVELYKDDAASYAVRAQVEEAMGKLSLAIDDISSAIDITAKNLTPNQHLSYADEYTQYVLQRIALYRKQMAQIKKTKSDDGILDKIEADEALLISKGIPSKAVKGKK
jgi:tetratricopeptide (TPR) repeat protein